MTRTWKVKDEAQLEEIAKQLLTDFKNNRVFTFSGNLGSGKTTFIKYLCKVQGVKGLVSSPTFAIVNEYEAPQSGLIMPNRNNKAAMLPVYHFDFYRIKNEREAYDMGYEEYFYSGGYCFIEWPEMIAALIPNDAVNVHIDVNDGVREISIKE